MGFSLRIFRFIFILFGFIAGFLGIAAGLFVGTCILGNQKSFGVSYFSPYLPYTNSTSDASYFMPPMWHNGNYGKEINKNGFI